MKLLGIDNVFFQVGNLEQALSLYTQWGFQLKFKIPRLSAVLLKIGEEEPGLMLFETHNPLPSHLWVEVDSAKDAEQELKEGSLLETATGLTLEVVDPWNNKIGFADYTKKPKLARAFSNNLCLIRSMKETDTERMVKNFCYPWSSKEQTQVKWERYYQEQKDQIRTVGIIEKEGHLVGYGSLLRQSKYLHFQQIPEINDLWIDQSYRKQGLGTKLINWLEGLARKEGYKQIGLGVGLYKDYGSAQKLYSRLGYKPDGQGITYHYKSVVPGKQYTVDDDLILWLIKTLGNVIT